MCIPKCIQVWIHGQLQKTVSFSILAKFSTENKGKLCCKRVVNIRTHSNR